MPGGCEPDPKDPLEIPTIRSMDPNEILGDEGYEEEQWVSVNDQLGYTVYFENDPEFATAPAQAVRITVPLDSLIDIFAFRLSDFGFGDFVFQVPPNSSFYSSTLDVVDSLGIYVDISAGIDVVNRNAFWFFQSIDPNTGLPPDDALTGFLPVNDTLTSGIDSLTGKGEGFVSFVIKPLSTAVTGDSITEQASIVFDLNEPLATNIWKNLIDAFPPASNILPGPAIADTNFVWLNFTGQDDPGGVGISFYDLYVSKNGDPYYLSEEGIDTTSFKFTGESEAEYCYYIRATDWVGNEEDNKSTAELCVHLGVHDSIQILNPNLNDQYCGGETIPITWETVEVDEVNISISTDGGISYTSIANNEPSANSPYDWVIPDNILSNECYIQIGETTANGFVATSPRFYIGQSDATFVNEVTCNPTDVGIDVNIFTNQWGCDSVVTATIALLPTDTVMVLETSCDSTMLGVATDYYTNQFGCDSLVMTTTEFEDNSVTTSINATSCDPSEVGVFENLLTAEDGCDSLVITTVSLSMSDTMALFETSCDSTLLGTETDLYINQFGCDSLVITTTAFADSDTTNISTSSCNSDDVGVFETLLTAEDGCDSLVITTVSLAMTDTLTVFESVCDSLIAGTFVDTLSNQFGCDSIVTTMATYVPAIITGLLADTSICAGNSVQFDIQAGATVEWLPVDGLSDPTIADPVATPLVTTTYTVFSWLYEDCMDHDTVTVTVNEPADAFIQESLDSLIASAGESYQWYLDGELIAGAESAFYVPVLTGNYSVEITDANGCVALSEITFVSVGVEELDFSQFSIQPNPANEYVLIKLKTAVPLDDFTIELLDMNGRVLMRFDQGRLVQSFETMIHLEEYASAVYVLRLSSADKVRLERIVVTR